ncbi:MAG: hypothetical protein EZS28_017986 [Streblomastix strix]|uniref:Uncharacterized protein n=1 Tax=Streblomastix strix TaxID=222440 RepID=A0A5J4VWD3_9EUKA|nr:MAG: hypothetical protein EZS28_017986 [Streblomastix strix]
MTPYQPLTDVRDANTNVINVFASDREITVTDDEEGPALRTEPMQKIQFYIMRFMELLTGRNAFAIDFWPNLIAQRQIRDYKARTLHAPEVTRHAEVPPHQVLNNAANSRVDGYIQNMQFLVLMLHKLTIFSIQYMMEEDTKKTLIDLVGICDALPRFAKRSTYIWLQINQFVYEAQQFDPGQDGVISYAIQPLHALRLIQGQGSQDLVNPQAGQYSATAMGPGQQIPQLVTFIPTQIVQQFYSGQLIPRSQVQQPFQGFGMYSGIQQFQGFPQPGPFQQAQPSSGYSVQLYRLPSITDGLPQFMQSSPTLGIQQTQQSNLLTPPEPNSAGHPAFQSSSQSQNLEQLNQQYNQLPTNQTTITRIVTKSGLRTQICKWKINRFTRNSFNKKDCIRLITIMEQEKHTKNRLKNFMAQRSYALRYIGLRSNGQHHRGFGKGLLNVSVFIQREARYEYLTVIDWKAFLRKVDTDFYLNTMRMNMTKIETIEKITQIQEDAEKEGEQSQVKVLQMDRIMRIGLKVYIATLTDNNQKIRIFSKRHDQALPPVQSVTEAPIYMSYFRTAQKDVFRRRNYIFPNFDEKSSVSWTGPESICQELNTPIAIFRTALQLLTAQDNQEQLNQEVNIQIQQQVNQLQEVNREIQILQQDAIVNSTQQNEQIQQIDVINLEQGIQQNIEKIPMNEQQNLNYEAEQSAKTSTAHMPQTEASENLQNLQKEQNENLNNIADQNPIQTTQVFTEYHLGPLFSQMNYPEPPGRTTDMSQTKLKSRQSTSRRQMIPSLTQTNPQSQIIPYQNQNQSSILNVDLMRMFTNPFSVPKAIQHQQIAGDAAQVLHAPRDTFSTNGNVRRAASSTDSVASGQVGVAGTKPINIQTAASTQIQVNFIHEPKIEKKGSKTTFRSKATSTNASVVANLNQSEDQLRRQPGTSTRTVPTNGNSEQNKGGDSYPGNLCQDPNGRNITISTKHGNGGKNNSLSGDMEIGKRSGILTIGVFPTIQKQGQRKDIWRETENLFVLVLRRRENSIQREIGGRTERKYNRRETSRVGQMIQSNIYNFDASLEMEENFGYQFTEYGDISDSFQDEWNRSSERLDKKRKLGNKSRSKIDFSPYNNTSTAHAIPSIRSNGESLLIYSITVWNAAFPNLLRTRTYNGLNQDMERVTYKNFELRRRSAPSTLEQRKIMKINLDNNENYKSVQMGNIPRKMRNRTKTTDQLPRVVLGLGKDVLKDDRPKETGTMLLINEIYLPKMETNPDQDTISSINNRQIEFSKSPTLKNKQWKENMILSKEILQELYLWQGVIVRNQDMTLEARLPEAVIVSDASPKGWRVTLELQAGDILVQHGEWNKEQKRWTSNKKEMEAIYLGLFHYDQVFKDPQIETILIKSDSSTAVQDLAKHRAGQTLVAKVKKIVKLCQQLKIQTQIQHSPGVSNKITDALSWLSTQGDYSVKREIFAAL